MAKQSKSFDRRAALEDAARARSRGQRRTAIALYRWALAHERSSIEIHQRLAPLLAETGQDFDAWTSYRAIAQAAIRSGREDRALATYREATRMLPQEIHAWQGLARMLVRHGQTEEAFEVLVEGSRQFRAHWNRPQSIHLLRRARAIDPWNFGIVIELARHLGRADQRIEARMLLERLALQHTGASLRRVRATEFAVSPGLRTGWRWLASFFQRGAEPAIHEDAAEEFPPLRALAVAETSEAPPPAATAPAPDPEREEDLLNVPESDLLVAATPDLAGVADGDFARAR